MTLKSKQHRAGGTSTQTGLRESLSAVSHWTTLDFIIQPNDEDADIRDFQ